MHRVLLPADRGVVVCVHGAGLVQHLQIGEYRYINVDVDMKLCRYVDIHSTDRSCTWPRQVSATTICCWAGVGPLTTHLGTWSPLELQTKVHTKGLNHGEGEGPY